LWFEETAMTVLSRKLLLAVCFVLIATPIAWAAQPVVFTILTQGNHSGISTFTQTVVRSTDEWAALWQRHAAGTRIPTVPPTVDFSRNMVIAVFFGKGPVGRRTAISDIVERGSQLVVLLQMIGPPGPESEDLPQITPFYIVQLARSPMPVVFMRAKIPDLYQPGR
jgi:hypothetical protein